MYKKFRIPKTNFGLIYNATARGWQGVYAIGFRFDKYEASIFIRFSETVINFGYMKNISW